MAYLQILFIRVLVVAFLQLRTSQAACIGYDIGSVANGDRKMSDDQTVITYNCHPGYMLNPSGDVYAIVKGSDGCWNGSAPECNRIDCGDPGQVEYATRTVTGEAFVHDTVVTYTCALGYRLADGSNTDNLKCLDTAQWSKARSSILCTLVSCGFPNPDIENGEYQNQEYHYLDTFVYGCAVGFISTNGEQTLKCNESGNFDGKYPTCKAVNCSDPGEPANGRRIAMDGYDYRDTVSYACEVGYLPYPHEHALYGICQSDGAWSNANLECRGVPCDPKESVYNSTHTPTTWRYPESVTFTCDPGFQARFDSNQNQVITCTQNGWDYEPPTCERVICSDAGEAQNVEVDLNVYRYTDVKRYVCRGGHVPDTGDMERTCRENRTFSGTSPTCRRVGCVDPGAFDHSTRVVQGFLFENFITYSCTTGYIVGTTAGKVDQTSQCTNNGTWNPPLELCRPAFCGPPDSQGLQVSGTSFEYPKEVTFNCLPGYIANGTDMTRQCQPNGLWDGDAPVCRRKKCPNPPWVPFSERVGNGDFYYRDEVFYNCYNGYVMVHGDPILACSENGTWSGTVPVCNRVTCPDPEAIENGRAELNQISQVYEDTMTYSCDVGYTFIPNLGNIRRKCEATATWSGRKPVCDRISCPDPGPGISNITYRTPKTGPFLYGDFVNYSCVVGSASVDELTVTYKLKRCNHLGGWDGEDLECEPIPCEPIQVRNASIQMMNATGFFFDDTARFSCVKGYIINGSKELYCQHTGHWNFDVPTCEVPFKVVVAEPEPYVPSAPVEAPDAERYGMVGIILISIELGCMVALDAITLGRDLKLFARNLRACCRRIRPSVAPRKDPNQLQEKKNTLTDAELELYMDDAWAYRSPTPSGMSYDDMSNSTSTLQDLDSSTTDLVHPKHQRPSTAARRLHLLAGLAGSGDHKGDKKKRKIQVAS